MGYCVSNIIGIRLSGVMSGPTDMEDIKTRIDAIKTQMETGKTPTDLPDNLDQCLSSELTGHKGSYAVIAGVWNNWLYPAVEQFALRLSEEFGTEVLLVSWDEQTEVVHSHLYLAGCPISVVNEHPLKRIIRRTS